MRELLTNFRKSSQKFLKLSNKRLKTQYKKIFSIFEKYSPELCLKIIDLDCLNEFHHCIWSMPFFKKIFEIKQKDNFCYNEVLYGEITDRILSYDAHLFGINVWTYRKIKFKLFGKRFKTFIRKETIFPDNDEFESFMKPFLISTPISIIDLPNDVKYKIISDL